MADEKKQEITPVPAPETPGDAAAVVKAENDKLTIALNTQKLELDLIKKEQALLMAKFETLRVKTESEKQPPKPTLAEKEAAEKAYFKSLKQIIK